MAKEQDKESEKQVLLQEVENHKKQMLRSVKNFKLQRPMMQYILLAEPAE